MAREQPQPDTESPQPARFKGIARRSSLAFAGAALALGTMAGWAYGVTENPGHAQSPQVYLTTHGVGEETTVPSDTTSTHTSEETTIPRETTTTAAGEDTTTTLPHETTTSVPEETTTTVAEGSPDTVPENAGEGETTETTVAGGTGYITNPERCRPPGHGTGNLPHGRAGNPAHVPNCRWGR